MSRPLLFLDAMTARTVPAYIPSHTKPDILFIGQAPAEEELFKREPLVGPSGREFNRMLRLAGIARGDCAITNVFNEQLPGNNIENILVETKEIRAKVKAGELSYLFTPIKRGWYLHPDWTHHLDRLRDEISAINPNLIVPLGDEALWAVTGEFGISTRRGAVGYATAPWMPKRPEGSPYKIVPTFHPAHVLRNYRSRIPTIADLMKAKREARYPELRLPRRELWLEPTLDDIVKFRREYLDRADLISIDIETAKGQITCIAFAPRRDLAICIPFTDWTLRWNYWPTLEDEIEAWRHVREICESPTPKLLQNGPYDIQWLWEKRRIKVVNYLHDTRLLHHAMYPELQKSLEVLGSLYENEAAWKQMRARKIDKRDD